MASITCPKHGRQFPPIVCKHIVSDVKDGIYPEMVTVKGAFGYNVCPNCYHQFELKKFEHLTDDYMEEEASEQELKDMYDAFKQVYSHLGLVPLCWECMAEVKVKQARSRGEPMPFDFYENTLTYQDTDVINELKDQLNAHFHFEKIPYPAIGGVNSFWISEGAFTYPLTIKIYRKVNPSEQQKILIFIDRFFETIPQKQRIVRFYRDIYFEHEARDGYGESVSKDELLLEKVVK